MQHLQARPTSATSACLNIAMMNLEQARFNMVEQQIRTWDVLDQDILELLYTVPREEFVPAARRSLAFADLELPIGSGERMWMPKMEARVLQDLGLRKADRVLEIGTGSGYFCALLAHRSAHVHSIEINESLAALGRDNLARHGTANVTLELGDGSRGRPGSVPYDVIVLTGSVPVLPGGLLEQLGPGGRLFAVIGERPIMNATLIRREREGGTSSRVLFETVIAPLANCEHPGRLRL
jgi:protein-L-isoaspartate(D-aspartate) O-methyltransferase